MDIEITSVADMAQQRLYEFIENLIKNNVFNDLVLWHFFNFLLEQASNYAMDQSCSYTAAYHEDKAKLMHQQRESERKRSKRTRFF
jgi:hypothetical protein